MFSSLFTFLLKFLNLILCMHYIYIHLFLYLFIFISLRFAFVLHGNVNFVSMLFKSIFEYVMLHIFFPAETNCSLTEFICIQHTSQFFPCCFEMSARNQRRCLTITTTEVNMYHYYSKFTFYLLTALTLLPDIN